MRKIIPLVSFILFGTLYLFSQEAPSTEGAAPQAAAQTGNYNSTGFEVFLYYPMGFSAPGWSEAMVDYENDAVEYQLPGVNSSFLGLGGGAEFDFGSRKIILDHMGFGMAFEINSFLPDNLPDGMEMSLQQLYGYLYYKTDNPGWGNVTFRAGFGSVRAYGIDDLFAYPEEREDTAGPLYTLEGAYIFPQVGQFRFQTGLAYRYFAVNTKDIHHISPQIRAGFRL